MPRRPAVGSPSPTTWALPAGAGDRTAVRREGEGSLAVCASAPDADVGRQRRNCGADAAPLGQGPRYGPCAADGDPSHLPQSVQEPPTRALGPTPSPTAVSLWLAGLKDLSTPEEVRDLLGQKPDPGSQAFLEALDRRTRTRPEIITFIQDSPEYRRRLVGNVFTTYLGRPLPPTSPSGCQSWSVLRRPEA